MVGEEEEEHQQVLISVREYDPTKDWLGVEDVEKRCEVGPSGKMSLFTDLLGDPICRVRHSPSFLMLVAEKMGEEKEIVGLIRGCIKTVTCGKKISRNGKNPFSNDSHIKPPTTSCTSTSTSTATTTTSLSPIYTKAAYILGLRVSPLHRRMGIGMKLVTRMEEWFRENGAEYSYMATDKDNQASINLFTNRCGYSKFRTPSILVQPVFAHPIKIPKRVQIFQLTPSQAETLYRKRFSTTEFFPRDIDSVLNNKLNLGTFVAVLNPSSSSLVGSDKFLADPPESWAVLSVWNCKDVFTLEVKGASRVKRGLAKTTRVVDRVFPWMGIPSVPQLFKPFGLHFLYGLGGEGTHAVKLIKALCGCAHNLAKERGCGVVATEVASRDSLRFGIPHWKKLSCAEDLWCMKRFGEDYSDGSVGDWTNSPPGLSIFVDPREF